MSFTKIYLFPWSLNTVQNKSSTIGQTLGNVHLALESLSPTSWLSLCSSFSEFPPLFCPGGNTPWLSFQARKVKWPAKVESKQQDVEVHPSPCCFSFTGQLVEMAQGLQDLRASAEAWREGFRTTLGTTRFQHVSNTLQPGLCVLLLPLCCLEQHGAALIQDASCFLCRMATLSEPTF